MYIYTCSIHIIHVRTCYEVKQHTCTVGIFKGKKTATIIVYTEVKTTCSEHLLG